MTCDWCQGQTVRDDLPSRRCSNCGGAHWFCATADCGRFVAECRGLCSACGSERRYPALDGQRKPYVTACRATGISIRSEAASGTGFDARRTEGYSHEGRVLIAGSKHVFVGPNPRVKASEKNPALGLVCEASSHDVSFSTPAPLGANAMLIASRSRVLAISLHTGEAQQIGVTGSAIQPISAAANERTGGTTEIWTGMPSESGTSLLRYDYLRGVCLELGTFSPAQSFAASDGIRAGAQSPGGDHDGSNGVWFFSVRKDTSAEGYSLDTKTGTFKECGRHYDVCALPRTPAERTALWWSGADSADANGEWFWISRGGWEDDGALPVQKMLRDQSKEIEYSPFRDTFLNRAASLSLSRTRDTEMSQRALDGAWVRTGAKVRWGWCGDEAVRLSSDPAPIGWSDEALMAEAGVKPVAEQIGPLIPTRWGFVAVVAERAGAGKPDAIVLVYFDFPNTIS